MKLEIIGSVKRETEKAILLDAEIDTQCGRSHAEVWFPKSRIEYLNGKVYITEANEWILDAKERELAESRRGFIGIEFTKVQ